MAAITTKISKGKIYYQLVDEKGLFLKYLGTDQEKWLTDAKIASLFKTETTIARALGDIRRKKALNPAFPKEKFSVVLADPPWRYAFDVESRATEKHYPTLTLPELKMYKDANGIPITATFAENCILFLWATAPKENEAYELIKHWRFIYKTQFIWAKDKMGLGWYGRNQHEILLIAERGGMPLPAPEDRPSSIIYAPRQNHSHKPEIFYELIEKMYPNREYLEMFGIENNREHWHIWGNHQYQ
jgi:N6-adenosine-specific RNA methylase IME4